MPPSRLLPLLLAAALVLLGASPSAAQTTPCSTQSCAADQFEVSPCIDALDDLIIDAEFDSATLAGLGASVAFTGTWTRSEPLAGLFLVIP